MLCKPTDWPQPFPLSASVTLDPLPLLDSLTGLCQSLSPALAKLTLRPQPASLSDPNVVNMSHTLASVSLALRPLSVSHSGLCHSRTLASASLTPWPLPVSHSGLCQFRPLASASLALWPLPVSHSGLCQSPRWPLPVSHSGLCQSPCWPLPILPLASASLAPGPSLATYMPQRRRGVHPYSVTNQPTSSTY